MKDETTSCAASPRTALSLCSVLMMLVLSVSSYAQQGAATATAEVTPNPAAPNQIVNYTITVENANLAGVPNLNLPAPLQISGGVSSSNEISIVNGVQSIVSHLTWPILCPQEGTFAIPAQSIAVGSSTTLTTNEVSLVVKAGATPSKPDGVAAGQDNGLGQMEPILQLRMGKTEFYQGEIVPITATLYLPQRLQLRRLGLIEVEKTDLAIQRFPQQADQSVETLGNIRYIALSFKSSLSALKAGKMKVGPGKTEIIVDIPVGNSRNFPFGFMQMDQRKLMIVAPEISIHVLPLPQEGRPKNFSGAVGEFTMNATTSSKEVTVGDPVAVDVMIEGQGNFDALEAPKLTDTTGWKTYPPKRFNVDTGDPNTADLINRKLGFNNIIVPDRVLPAVPPYEFAFFSPRTKQYTNLRSQPIPIVIKPGAQAAAEPAAAASGASSGSTSATPHTQAPEADITDILMPIPLTPRWATAAMPLLSDNRFIIANGVLFAAFLGLLAWSLWSRIQFQRARSTDHLRRDLLNAAQASGLSEAEFFRRAAHYVMHVTRGQVPAEARDIIARYEALNFAGPHAGAQPIDATTRSQVLALLPKLQPAASAPPPLPARSAFTTVLLLAMTALAHAAPQDEYQAAAKALEKSDFKAASAAAEAIVKGGDVSPEVFTLLGHASYKQGQPGIAAMWYQRAQMFPGSVPELRQNLRHIEEKIHFFTFEQNEWLQRFGFFMTRNGWIFTATIGAWLAIFSIAFLVLGARSKLKAWAAITLLVGIAGVALGAIGYNVRPAAEEIQQLAFVTAAKAQAHTAASQTSGSVIPVPPGSVVRKLNERGGWTYVEIPQPGESLRGWLRTSEIENWWPYDAAKLP